MGSTMKFSVSRGRQFLQYVLPAVMRPLRVLWNQIIGFVFVVLAVWALPRCVESAREFDGQAGSFFRLALSALFVVIMAAFGIYSFLKARKAAKS
ncbi:MAG TPA: hypothetical protein PLA43_03830 [Bryobacteraceae bacterium]|nr:hypothetical protein [Bryobacteraceae bacterium]